MSYETEYLIEKLKEAFEIIGHSPSAKDLSRLGFPSRKAYRDRFGTFKAAKEQLGIPKKGDHPKRKRKYWAPQKKRFEILHRDGFRCRYCGATPDIGAVLQVDHIVPKSKGGTAEKSNLITACSACNIGKGVMTLINKPKR